MRLARSLLRFLFCLSDARRHPVSRSSRPRVLAFPLLGVMAILGSAAHAQTVRWERSDAGMPNAVLLVFEDCTPVGEPQLTSILGVAFTRIGQTSAMNGVNFQVTRSVILPYQVRGKQSATIPTFNVKTDNGSRRAEAFNIAAPAPPLESVASAKLVPERTSVWAGE